MTKTQMCLGLSLVMMAGCHGRFKKHATNIDAVQVSAVTLAGPNVNLAYSAGGDVASTAFNITQMVREGNIAAHIADKVNPDQVNAAFVQGFSDQLSGGPPFGTSDAAGPMIEFQLVDWGMDMRGFGSPGVYHYNVRVRGYGADGKTIYKTSFQCAADAGVTGWVEMSPFVGANNENKIKNLPAEEIQAIFDASAHECGKQFVAVMRKHAG